MVSFLSRARLASLVPLLLLVLLVAPATAGAALAPESQQVLKVNVGTLPSSLDPGKAQVVEDLVVQNAMFAPLYRSPGGTGGTLVPFLATGAPTVSSSGLRYVVQLRAASWSDGRPIRASDVVFAFNRARTESSYGTLFSNVRTATATGPRTVRFDLSTPTPWFSELLASNVVTPVPAHVIRKYGPRWTRFNRLVTSGPFQATSGRGRTELILEPSPTWWGASTVRLQQLELLAIPVASASPLFRAERLDATLRDTSVHASAIASWSADPRFRTTSSGAGQFMFINSRVPALANPFVRRGIALAMDRAAIAKLSSSGVDRPLTSFMPSGIRASASIAPADATLLRADGAPRAAEAVAALAAGGWVAGTRLDLHFASDGYETDRIALAIQSQLLAVGIPVDLRPMTASAIAKVGFGISPVGSGVDLVLQGWTPDHSDPQSLHQLFTCANIDAGLNIGNLCSVEYDAAYAATTGTTGAARVSAHRAAEALLSSSTGLFPAVPLYEPRGEHLVQPWVRGFIQHPSGRVDFERITIHTR
jgi:oligopeptide transport system substrate-binding protein